MSETKVETLDDVLIDLGIQMEKNYVLILWNDDVNSMEHVLLALVEICGLDPQTSYTKMMEAHTNGKTVIKKDSLSVLEQMKKGLNDRLIEATIEEE